MRDGLGQGERVVTHEHNAPRDCPVCRAALSVTRLSCGSCGTELSGSFENCMFCALGHDDRETLRVFLTSRGNLKEVERHLGVSYPTARARFDELLGRIGIVPVPATDKPALSTLEQLAKGVISVDEALKDL